MLLVLFTWLYAWLVFSALGCLFQRFVLKNEATHPFWIILNGMFVYMIIIWTILYFRGYNVYFQAIVGVASMLILYVLRSNCQIKKQILKQWHTFHGFEKFFTLVIFVLSAAVSSTVSLLPDNESYYIQTVKWANEQGFVYGLMNIHPFLGQFSGWHILQAGINGHQAEFTANALNGFLLIWFVFWVFSDSDQYFSGWLRYGLVFAPVWVVTTGAPSPDLPVWLLSLTVFDLFVKLYKRIDNQYFNQFIILTFFGLLIKPTTIVNLFLLMVLWIKYFKKLKKNLWFLTSFGLLFAVFWLSKNFILTGYAFYPFNWGGKVLQPVWQYPPELLHFLKTAGQNESHALVWNNLSSKAFVQWLFPDKFPEKIFNPAMLIFILIFPFIINRKKQNRKALLWIYLTNTVYLTIILFINPNSRFFMHGLMFMSLLILHRILPEKSGKLLQKASFPFLATSLAALLFLKGFNYRQIMVPRVSGLPNRFKTYTKARLHYHAPQQPDLFWQTGDAPLPAIAPRMLRFFEKEFGYYPQPIPNKKAYYSKKE